MNGSKEFPVRRFDGGKVESIADPVVNERRIELDVNDGRLRMGMLVLPSDLEAFAVGFLLGEGVLRGASDLTDVTFDDEEGVVYVRGDFDDAALDEIMQRWTWGSGCGSGGTSRDLNSTAYASVGAGPVLSPETILERMKELHARMKLWKSTGGVHGCGLADANGIVLVTEDVGRHNAFDKIMGRAAMEGIGAADKFMLTTGRLSAEIVSKAVACGLPMLVSRGAATALGIQVARRFGLTLVGFARGKRLNVYTGYERVVPESSGDTAAAS